MEWKIPLFKIYWDEKDVAEVTKAVKAGMNGPKALMVGKVVEMISNYVGMESAVVFNSGTSALHAALLAH